jgi:hypothetical protein
VAQALSDLGGSMAGVTLSVAETEVTTELRLPCIGCEPTSILGIVEVCGVGLASVVGFITLLVGCDRCRCNRGKKAKAPVDEEQ